MNQGATIYQRRIVISAIFCAAAFALVGARLVDVTLFKPHAAGSEAIDRPAMPRADMVTRLTTRTKPRAILPAPPAPMRRGWSTASTTPSIPMFSSRDG